MKITFINQLQVTYISPNGFKPKWQILSPFIINMLFDRGFTDHEIVIPTGFVTDFGSVPRLPLAYLLSGGIADKSCTLHDYLYSEKKFSRAICDEILLNALETEKVGWFKRHAMYRAVRIFGAKRYER